MPVIETRRFFGLMQTHNSFDPADRKADLRGRLSCVADDPDTDDLTERLLNRHINRQLAKETDEVISNIGI